MKRDFHWLRTNEREDAVRSLEWCAETAKTVRADPHGWKWLLISLHNAVQGYMVVALEKGDLITIRELRRRTKLTARLYDVLWWLLRCEADKARVERARTCSTRRASAS